MSEHSAVVTIIIVMVLLSITDAIDRFPLVASIRSQSARLILYGVWIGWAVFAAYLVRTAWAA